MAATLRAGREPFRMEVVVMGAYEEIEDLLVYSAGGHGVALLAA